jgi:hypothetical protein
LSGSAWKCQNASDKNLCTLFPFKSVTSLFSLFYFAEPPDIVCAGRTSAPKNQKKREERMGPTRERLLIRTILAGAERIKNNGAESATLSS